MVKIKCPVCCGTGKVDSDFGGGCPGGSKKSCPACCGTGMQDVSDYVWRRKPCEKKIVIPWTNPCPPYTYPYTPWYTAPTITWTNQTGSATTDTKYTTRMSCSNSI